MYKPLNIDKTVIDRARAMVAWATANPISYERMMRVIHGEMLPKEVMQWMGAIIPVDHQITYAHEFNEHGELHRHLVVSIKHDYLGPMELPSVSACHGIIKLYQFRSSIGDHDAHFILEPDTRSFNFIERI